MKIVYTGSEVSENIKAGTRLLLSGGSGVLSIYSASGLVDKRGYSTSGFIGPYSSDMLVKVSCITGVTTLDISTDGTEAKDNQRLINIAVGVRYMLSVSPLYQYGMGEANYIAKKTVTKAGLVLQGAALDPSNGWEETIGADTYYRASIIVDGVPYQITKNGEPLIMVKDGTILETDLVQCRIVSGQQIKVRLWQSNAIGCLYLNKVVDADATTEFSASPLPDKTMSMQPITQTGSQFEISPIAVIGYAEGHSIMGLGDSRFYGLADTTDATRVLGQIGRAIAPYYPYMSVSQSGRQLNKTVLAGHIYENIALARYATHLVCNMARNDFSAGQTLAQMQDLITIDLANKAKEANPDIKIIYCTQVPDTNTANTAVKSTTFEALRNQFNDWLKAGRIKNIHAYWDIASAVESTVTPGLWADASYYSVTDGTHETQAGYLQIAASGVVDLRKLD